jgi:GTP cyclohydrolase I
VLKRPDEKYVTERAYDNPKFVEDIVRDVSSDLVQMLDLSQIEWFYVQINNFESIHNHDAFAKVERGEPGRLVSPKRGSFVESIKS